MSKKNNSPQIWLFSAKIIQLHTQADKYRHIHMGMKCIGALAQMEQTNEAVMALAVSLCFNLQTEGLFP